MSDNMVIITTIQHDKQRYPTCGDWWITELASGLKLTEIRVSKMGDWRYEFLVGLHELVEAALCRHRGISGETVDAWDLAHLESEEPGLEPNCPYGKEHREAESIERQVSAWLGVDWLEYCVAIAELSEIAEVGDGEL